MKETLMAIRPFLPNEKINVNEAKALRDWADKLETTTSRLKAAVNRVGDSALKVEAFLNRK